MYGFSLITIRDLERIEYQGSFPGIQTNWISNWYNTFSKVEDNIIGYSKKPYIITVHEGTRLVAIVPLLKLTRTYFKFFKLDFLEFLGQQWSGLGYDIIKLKSLDDCFTKDLTKWIRNNISYHFLFLKYLPKSTSFKQKYKLYRYAGAPYIKASSFVDYEDFSKNVYSRKFREELRRTYRSISKNELEMTTEVEEINESSLKHIRAIAKSKVVDGKSFLYGNSSKENFHLKVYETFPSKVVFIRFNGKPVAYATEIDFKGKRIGIDASFNRKFRKYGIGIHCIDEVIRNSFKEGAEMVSFGLGLDSYKFRYCNKIEEFFMCFDFKFRLKSLLALPYMYYRLKKTDKMVGEIMDKALANRKKRRNHHKRKANETKIKLENIAINDL